MRLLILPGDGIGPEIMAATVTAFEALNGRFGLKLDLRESTIGLSAHAAGGSTFPDAILEEARSAEGVILGPVDTVAYPPKEEGGIYPSSTIRK